MFNNWNKFGQSNKGIVTVLVDNLAKPSIVYVQIDSNALLPSSASLYNELRENLAPTLTNLCVDYRPCVNKEYFSVYVRR